jgi:hypothetical protein
MQVKIYWAVSIEMAFFYTVIFLFFGSRVSCRMAKENADFAELFKMKFSLISLSITNVIS